MKENLAFDLKESRINLKNMGKDYFLSFLVLNINWHYNSSLWETLFLQVFYIW